MDRADGKTVLVQLRPNDESRGKVLQVEVVESNGVSRTAEFFRPFVIGRDSASDLAVSDDGVSRRHAEVFIKDGNWWIRDLGSRNGTFLNGVRVQQAPLSQRATVELSAGGPTLRMMAQDQVPPHDRPASSHTDVHEPEASITQYVRKYFSAPDSDHRPGERTEFIRLAFQRVQKRKAARYRIVLGALLVLLIGAIGIASYQFVQLKKTEALAIQIFYEIKALELEIASLRSAVAETRDQERQAELQAKDAALVAMMDRYERFREEIRLLGGYRSHEDLIIFRIARLFGECDLNLPDDFRAEVKRYIRSWKQSRRLEQAIERVEEGGYGERLGAILRAHGLPPHFLYLALQESDFKPKAIGPATRYGIAKGVWQFIPSTARQYGLALGPQSDDRVYDPLDERFDLEKATVAAARYLRDIYDTEAQASGLLVMSAYNWGHNAVRRRIQEMPVKPEERNFWRLLETHRIPKETYNYVLNIFSAAVIAEDPAHFGFDFENPLGDLPSPGRAAPGVVAPVETEGVHGLSGPAGADSEARRALLGPARAAA